MLKKISLKTFNTLHFCTNDNDDSIKCLISVDTNFFATLRDYFTTLSKPLKKRKQDDKKVNYNLCLGPALGETYFFEKKDLGDKYNFDFYSFLNQKKSSGVKSVSSLERTLKLDEHIFTEFLQLLFSKNYGEDEPSKLNDFFTNLLKNEQFRTYPYKHIVIGSNQCISGINMLIKTHNLTEIKSELKSLTLQETLS